MPPHRDAAPGPSIILRNEGSEFTLECASREGRSDSLTALMVNPLIEAKGPPVRHLECVPSAVATVLRDRVLTALRPKLVSL